MTSLPFESWWKLLIPRGSFVWASSHAGLFVSYPGFRPLWCGWMWHGLVWCIGLFDFPIGVSQCSVPSHFPRVVAWAISAFGVCCGVGITAVVLVWMLMLRSRCVLAFCNGWVAMSCCGIFVCWGMIVIMVGDCVVIRISFGATPWDVFSNIVISWRKDRSCLSIFITLRDVFLVSFPVGVEICTPDLFFGMGSILWTHLPEPLVDPRRSPNHLLSN